MAELLLKHGYVATIDDEDYEAVAHYKWRPNIAPNQKFYVTTSIKVDGKWKGTSLHRMILRLHGSIPDGYHVDHIDANPLNNRKENLRAVTIQQNGFNRRKHAKATSKFKGVYWNKKAGRWKADIKKDGRKRFIGLFDDELEAAQAYNRAAMELFGEFACLNDLTLGYTAKP